MVAETRLGIEGYVASEPESRPLEETQAQRFEMGEQRSEKTAITLRDGLSEV